MHRIRVFSLIFFIYSFYFACYAGDSAALIVSCRQGLLLGIKEDSVCAWKGIPYAKAPIGELRFRAPQAAVSWNGIRDASHFGAVSPQPRRATREGNLRSEDCLSLNIWSPAADGKKRPVMFWIHGGGFLSGSGASPLYHGGHLAANGDVVVVTINYRLGPFGFLFFGDMGGEKQGFDDNLGIRDQVAALQWVQQNIEAFGGDPGSVTIFGESAGAVSVLSLLAVPSAHGLFKRAIVESGSPEFLMNRETSTGFTARYLKMLGVSSDSLARLRALPTDSLMAVMNKLINTLMHEPTTVKIPAPTIDGSFIPMDPMTAIRSGKATGIELMIGTNKDEATLLALKRIGIVPHTADELKPYLEKIAPEARKKLIDSYRHYPHKDGIMEMTTDGIFAMPSIRVSELQTHFAATYMYRFDWSSFPLRLLGLRACHGLELPFVFGNIDRNPGKYFTTLANKKVVRRISQNMQQSWINFARYGNPDPTGVAEWRKYDPAIRSTMIFNRTSHPSADPGSRRRQAWVGLSIF